MKNGDCRTEENIYFTLARICSLSATPLVFSLLISRQPSAFKITPDDSRLAAYLRCHRALSYLNLECASWRYTGLQTLPQCRTLLVDTGWSSEPIVGHAILGIRRV